MIVGTEGIFTWEDGGVVLNDRRSAPHYRIDSISGLRSLGELNAESDTTPGRVGEAARKGARAGKSITFEGSIVGDKTLIGLRQAQSDLTAAFATSDVRKMIAGPHPDYDGDDELPLRFFHARPLTCDPDEARILTPNRSRSGGYEMPFTLTLRLDDPRVYHEGVVIDEEDDVLEEEDGAGVPFVPGSSIVPASSEGLEVTVTNDGTADVEGIFYIYGPITNPVLSNDTLGSFIRFRGLTIDADAHITIDFRRRRIRRAVGDENIRHTFDPTSTWWDQYAKCLLPGENVIRLRGYRVFDGAKLRVTFTPGDW